MEMIKKIGLIINPVAGMGGKVALKGTDGAALEEAVRRGARPESGDKARRALQPLLPLRDKIRIYTAAGPMGADICAALSLPFEVVYTPEHAATGAEDTLRTASRLLELGMDLLLFAGGDGTARNVCEAVGTSLPVLGVPAGVKIQSAVFALTPESAGTLLLSIAKGTPMSFCTREVVDLDEDAYRSGAVSASLYGVMRVPDAPKLVQSMKEGGFAREQDQLVTIARYLRNKLEPGTYYAIGSGSTAKCLLRLLELDYELLGVDILQDGRLVKKDAMEQELWEIAQTGNLRIIVSPIGGQGFLFGRGNHQFSARILKAVGKDGITVISQESKLLSIKDRTLHIDCGDESVNESLRGYYNVLCGYGYFHPLRCR